MTLADSDLVPDEMVADDMVVVATDKPSSLMVATNCVDTAGRGANDYNGDTPKESHDGSILTTPLSNVTASTSNDESLDESPSDSSEAPDPTEAIVTEVSEGPSRTIIATTGSEPTPQMDNKNLTGSDSISTEPPPVVLPPALSKQNTTNENHGIDAKTLYSLRLPGVGKVLAINTVHSCDIDTLYEQGKKACDVDAFVGNDDNTDDDDSDLPLYSSTIRNGGMGHCHHRNDNDDDDEEEEFDIEANRASITSIIRRIDPPLDPHCDPFAHRVGKKLSWRNVNMTLVCVVNAIFAVLFFLES
jgi:hypothetical protein